MKRRKMMSPMLRNRDSKCWTPVSFEIEYFLNEETESVLTDTVIYFFDQHLTCLSQLKPTLLDKCIRRLGVLLWFSCDIS